MYLRTTLLKSESSGESPSEFVLKSGPKLLEDGREVHSFDQETCYYFSVQYPDSDSSRLKHFFPEFLQLITRTTKSNQRLIHDH
ncbi:hypothetical protein C1H46_007230 [Malus baccata]|uniref:Uncharacterized protein n=1 Tax=Malus baccata TaxID=106549 RepID=A0A540N805_MALBA|nr:hypothetical protein C1H46_007230 [Malus baccata]